MNKFEELGIDEVIIKAVSEMGFENPTPIQEQAIPALLKGERDLVGLAQTGTGKTAAFGIPLLQKVDFESRKTQALILCPTRELCVQITKDLTSYSKYIKGTNIVPVYGGASIDTQIRLIQKGAQVIVATPGRMADLIKRKKADLSEVGWVVLDEADEMLDMGFKDELDVILDTTPKDKNTWLFSATMPREVAQIAKNFMVNPVEVSVGGKNQGAENISHEYYVVQARDRYAALKRIVDFQPDIFGMVFCRTRIETQEIAEKLMKDGYNADALHGDMSQQQRDKVMQRFRSRSLQLLVATDVAARGIDVSSITHVIHFSLPDDIENYTHRSGRTARAGKTGVSIAIINLKEVGKIRELERKINAKFTRKKVPSGFDVCGKQLFSLIKKVHDVEVNEAEINQYLPKIYSELEDLSKEELIKKFVSIEFNRFLSYYKNAPDLNADESKSARERDISRNGNYTRFFINIGDMDNVNKAFMVRFICDNADIRNDKLGKIDIKNSFSFFEVEASHADQVLSALNNQNYKGRPVKVELSESKGGGGFGGGSSRGKYGGGGSSFSKGKFGGGAPSRGKYGGGGSSFSKEKPSGKDDFKRKRPRIKK